MTQNNNQLPKDWKWVKLGEAFSFIGGGTPSKKESSFWNGNIFWASVKDVKGDYLNSTEDTITETGLKNSASNIAEPNDVILITRISPGKTIITNIRTAINQDLKIAKPKFKTTSKFINYYFKSIERKLINKSSGTTVLGITLNNLNEITIPLLNIETQNIIVSKIEELFSEIENGIKSLLTTQQQLKTYRQSVLKWAFEGKLSESGFTGLEDEQDERQNKKSGKSLHPENPDSDKGELPKGWKWVKLGEVIEKPKYGTSKKCDYKINGIGVLRIPNIVKGIVDSKDLKFAKFDEKEIESYSLKEGDILTIRSNGSVDIVGKCALITKTDEQFLYAGYLIRLRPLKKLILSKYLINILCSIDLRNQIERKAKSTSGVNNINSEELAGLIISVPSIAEQHRIVQEIESRLSVADKMEESINQSLQQAEALRQSILKKAFEGKLI